MDHGSGEDEFPGRWGEVRAWAWYRQKPWPVGCNYMPSSAVNFLAMWYGPGFDAETIARELGWAARVGFNSVRTNFAFTAWQAERHRFIGLVERFLEIAAASGLSVMPCLFDDCGFGGAEPVYAVQQAPVPGLHNSRAVASPGRAAIMDKQRWLQLEDYASDVISRFRSDERILAWDLYNEPGNADVFAPDAQPADRSRLEAAAHELMRETFAWARCIGPQQPLTVAAWRVPANNPPPPPLYRNAVDRSALELSDIISFHAYCGRAVMQAIIDDLSGLGRPLLCTEWMARPLGSRIADVLPLFAGRRVGAWQWGLVRGLSQTHIPWPALAQKGADYDAPGAEWFHDLLHADGAPHDPQELRVITQCVAAASGG